MDKRSTTKPTSNISESIVSNKLWGTTNNVGKIDENRKS